MKVTYETAVSELFERIPEMRSKYRTEYEFMGEEAPQYLVFSSLLIPSLERALEMRDLRMILLICAYLEDAAESAAADPRLADLLAVEVGEWLGGAANEEVLSPWLGSETKRICHYVPGRGIQRRNLNAEGRQKRLGNRIASLIKKTFRG